LAVGYVPAQNCHPPKDLIKGDFSTDDASTVSGLHVQRKSIPPGYQRSIKVKGAMLEAMAKDIDRENLLAL